MKLTKRIAIGIVLAVLTVSSVSAQQGKLKPFRFRVKTHSGGIINTTIMARDVGEAFFKIKQRYKGSEILNLYPKKENRQKESTRKRK